ncbi:MAG: NADH-dependent [FeFe] hydrogenase, group A6 [Bacteroidales bacterium]|jgi:NADP-reducing hydrogenase subunit HndD|nr:NADH-dependent [FeFe] hydrogenase, group A6 [Bacteroidales bacterium]
MLTINIDNVPVKVEEGTTILEAAQKIGIEIPTLCHHDDLCIAGNCRVCVVEEKGKNTLTASCATPVIEGMKILTHSAKVQTSRKHIVELLLSEHDEKCTKCYKNGNCELQDLASKYTVGDYLFMDLCEGKEYKIDDSSPAIQFDPSKCVKCQRCVRTCSEIQGVNVITVAEKGKDMHIQTFMGLPLNNVPCTNCGQCVNHCPTGALTERMYYDEIWEAMGDDSKHVIVNTAPSVRVALGEMLGYPTGTRVTGKMAAALRQIGADSVLDTDFTADLTIIEEGHELLQRLKKALVDKEDVSLPMITSCSPGWIKYIEHMFPYQLAHLSTCKSPQQMFGALAKTYYAEKMHLDPKDIVSVSIMPCSAKKFEANRPEMHSSGYQDIDAGLTTRELGHMIKQSGINFLDLEPQPFDSLMGESSGAGVIFGATGGVMEAALRTAYEVVTGRQVPFDNLEILPVRGTDGIKEASIKIEGSLPEWNFLEGVELKVAVSHGLKNARIIMKQIEAGESPYHFIEIMACPGGCIGGGGQPIPTNAEIRKKRIESIYEEDRNMTLRKSHENSEVKKIYDDFLKEPLGEKSHKLLHTSYTKRNKF